MPRVYAIKFEQATKNCMCSGSLLRNGWACGNLLGPDQNGYPSLSLWFSGKLWVRLRMLKSKCWS